MDKDQLILEKAKLLGELLDVKDRIIKAQKDQIDLLNQQIIELRKNQVQIYRYPTYQNWQINSAYVGT